DVFGKPASAPQKSILLLARERFPNPVFLSHIRAQSFTIIISRRPAGRRSASEYSSYLTVRATRQQLKLYDPISSLPLAIKPCSGPHCPADQNRQSRRSCRQPRFPDLYIVRASAVQPEPIPFLRQRCP